MPDIPIFKTLHLSAEKMLHNCDSNVITSSGADRYILFCGPIFVPAFVSSQPNFKVK